MLYRRNCNTLLSSSLQRCYINGVCFAFQLAALWKKMLCYLSLGTSTHIQEWGKKGGGTGTWWADLGFQVVVQTRHTSMYVIWGNEKEKPMTGRNGRPSHLSTWSISLICSVPVPCQTTELPPTPPQPGSQSAVVNQSNPINRQLFG